MTIKRVAAVLGASVMVTAGVGIATATSAQAAVPSCVTTSLNDSGTRDYLTVRNGCGSSQRVKVVLANATDFSCYTIASGGARNYSWNYPGRFDGLQSC
ncbi:hypothetical protein [Actinoplanes sp. M2I2]|uniref:hypothetical protein n=1 Tax=Actinoplanes sp. M2I2 TaxID=1734444 RepID=UPI0020225A94|nr:hypothetical protein [Actinoplanes sp. M2I2]